MNKNLKDRADRLLSSIYLDGYTHGYNEGIKQIENYVMRGRMRIKDAINNLKWLLECSYVDSFTDSENEALDIAIKALEALDKSE